MTGSLTPDDFFSRSLKDLEARSLLRDPADAGAREQVVRAARALGVAPIDASSNDYLGLGGLSVSRETIPATGLGAGASRLVQGTRAEHEELEREVADWVRTSSALLFTSGFSANVGLLAAVADSNAAIISDELNHASIIDGCRLARARVTVIPHLSLPALEEALRAAAASETRWFVTESYFSMDGDGPDLEAVAALCRSFDAGLILDEAHALGIFGPAGAGRAALAGVRATATVGTLGKAVGAQGAFVAGSTLLRNYLWNRARSFVFSTAPSPLLTALTRFHVAQVRRGDGLRELVLKHSARLRQLLVTQNVELVRGSFGPIVPVLVGDSERAVRFATILRERGILAQPIRPPTVPKNAARVRLTLQATFSEADVERLALAVVTAWRAS